MNKKNLYFTLGFVLLIVINVAHGAEAPRTSSGEIINLGQAVFNDYKDLTQFALERGFRVTADIANPKKHNKGSLHSKGLAIDVSIKMHTPEDVEEFMLEAKAAGIRVLDERCRPKKQKVWGGSHVHLEISKKRSTNQKGKCRASRPTPVTEPEPPPPVPPPAPEPPPPPPAPAPETPPSKPEKFAPSGTISSIECSFNRKGSALDAVDYWNVSIKGTAKGIPGTGVNYATITCQDWKDCTRHDGEPESTQWTVVSGVSISWDNSWIYDGVFNGGNSDTIYIKTPYMDKVDLLPPKTKVCPQ